MVIAEMVLWNSIETVPVKNVCSFEPFDFYIFWTEYFANKYFISMILL
jgi:hypothetical protein